MGKRATEERGSGRLMGKRSNFCALFFWISFSHVSFLKRNEKLWE